MTTVKHRKKKSQCIVMVKRLNCDLVPTKYSHWTTNLIFVQKLKWAKLINICNFVTDNKGLAVCPNYSGKVVCRAVGGSENPGVPVVIRWA